MTALLCLWGGIVSRSEAGISEKEAGGKIGALRKVLNDYQHGMQEGYAGKDDIASFVRPKAFEALSTQTTILQRNSNLSCP